MNRPLGVVSIPRIPSAENPTSIIANYESDRDDEEFGINVNLKDIQDSEPRNIEEDSKQQESTKKRTTKAQRKSTRKQA